jgi:AraC-like DNA-binding protein
VVEVHARSDRFAVAACFLVVLSVVGLRPPARALDPEMLDAAPPRRMRVAEGEVPAEVQALKVLMEGERLYVEGDLRLYEVASRLGITTHELSELLNHHLETTFHDFVNGYRVRHAIQRLDDPESRDFTLAAIAEESGFSSKSSFNRAFKKVTGLTPSQYQKKLPGGMDTGGGAASVL